MTNFRKLIADIAIIVVAVIAYSPGLIALRPSDESVLRAGLSIMVAPGLVLLFFYVNYFADRDRNAEKQKQSREKIGDLDSAIRVYGALESRAFSDDILRNRQTLELTKSLIAEMKANIDDAFGNGSRTYDKFAGAADNVADTMAENSALAAKRIIAAGDSPDPSIVRNVKKIAEDNQQLYRSLKKLDAEIILLGDSDGSDREIQKISELIDEMKYYKEGNG